jgi:hypothetical protein
MVETPLTVLEFPEDYLELSRVFAAATVNPEFCHLLLEDPEQALAKGFQGETFLLPEYQKQLLLLLRTDNLAELAEMMIRGKTYLIDGIVPPPFLK